MPSVVCPVVSSQSQITSSGRHKDCTLVTCPNLLSWVWAPSRPCIPSSLWRIANAAAHIYSFHWLIHNVHTDNWSRIRTYIDWKLLIALRQTLTLTQSSNLLRINLPVPLSPLSQHIVTWLLTEQLLLVLSGGHQIILLIAVKTTFVNSMNESRENKIFINLIPSCYSVLNHEYPLNEASSITSWHTQQHDSASGLSMSHTQK